MTPLLKQVLGLGGMLLIMSGGLVGCDSGKQSVSVTQSRVEKYEKTITLHGLVSNDDGPVKTGIIKAHTESGQELSQVELVDDAQYSLPVPAGTVLPIILTYYPSADATDEQRMQAVAIHAITSKYDINPLSTRIVLQAKALGGYTHKNLVRAAESSGTMPDDNKTTSGFRGDPTTQYGGWH